ncbi:probable CoA ligase CCL7, partial [Homalodisca vitripennis]|uniref:probable CoA ligase CCL7 n=1 Tax=Homalodisca vitripennis TaxID=197043 RepID=UPI001EEB3209
MFIQKVLQGRTGVQSLYGMTETGILTTWRNRNLLDLSKINSTGYLAPGVEIKIMNDEGVEVLTESLGELWVKSIAMMSGYWNQPELTKQLFDNDGFFQTGDAGCFDKDGFLYIKGRVKDLIDFKGSKVSNTSSFFFFVKFQLSATTVTVSTSIASTYKFKKAYVSRRFRCHEEGQHRLYPSHITLEKEEASSIPASLEKAGREQHCLMYRLETTEHKGSSISHPL